MKAKEFNECLNKIRNGDKSKLEVIYDNYFKLMLFCAFNIVKNREDAEEIVANFFVYILEDVQAISYIEKPTPWVCRIIKNKAIDFVRKDVRKVALTNYYEFSQDLLTYDSQTDLIITLLEALEKLNEIEKEIFELHYLVGYKYSEIAEMLSRPVGTIKWYVSQIKIKLKHLKEYK
ncbi:MAG: RNA polymerase sigma factor [Firmicutes bacterium]|nr:RNA polymerase sigma factor [Bacillota bacterium]